LEKGMVVTVEPGIYLEGKFGVRVEDMVLITNRAKILTKQPRKIFS
jgi:Xaa-Pro dipeptidase